MSAQPKANEPSMEEILASIRKIISDDQSKAPAAVAVEQPAPPPAPVPVAVVAVPVHPALPPDDDILDLGSEAVSLEDVRKNENDILFEPAASMQKTNVEQPAFVAQDQNVSAMMTVPHAAEVDMSSLLSNQASSSISSAFGSLAHTVLSQNARTVDDLVKEMLKPLLKGWLDDNLPTLVERLVRAEIERVARGGRG